ncbi:TonB family protein [Luteimonas sp. MC1828]|uniref:TonB family protein n=1 Tax=Luteimonas sp. MC1828 TaxID=2799787 RepID=UPI0018F17FA1|nr:TonB family protein [Luteimonas sp. MC1828]MBJ7575288.1 TonB family protein [Luteimonas sp. MC1828]
MFRFVLATMLALSAIWAPAQGARKSVAGFEVSMLVTGDLDIETDGSVSRHTIDRAEKIPPYAVNIIQQAISGWRFEPVVVDGKPVPARARMTLRLLGTPMEDGGLAVRLASATFGERGEHEGDRVSSIKMTPPRYPRAALHMGATGTAYLMLKIGPDGSVADAVAEQVNLRFVSDAMTMTAARKEFASTAIAAARRWTFAPPTTGDDMDGPWTVRVPVTFAINSEATEEGTHGKWVAYIPGPRQPAPWAKDESEGNDAIADGSFHQAGTGYRLLTPLQSES